MNNITVFIGNIKYREDLVPEFVINRLQPN
jgi:hypothetical protein